MRHVFYAMVGVILLGLAPIHSHVWAGPAEQAVQASLDAQARWLGSGAAASGWDDYLLTAQLHAQLARGAAADRREVAEILTRYESQVPGLERRAPTEKEAEALRDLDSELQKLPPGADGEVIQHAVFEVGKRHPFESLRAWFQALYETLLGSSQGPRMGSFIALYGIDNSRRLIAEALSN